MSVGSVARGVEGIRWSAGKTLSTRTFALSPSLHDSGQGLCKFQVSGLVIAQTSLEAAIVSFQVQVPLSDDVGAQRFLWVWELRLLCDEAEGARCAVSRLMFLRIPEPREVRLQKILGSGFRVVKFFRD